MDKSAVKLKIENPEVSAGTKRMNAGDRLLSPGSVMNLIMSVLAFLVIVATGSKLYLDYVHVLMGDLWTGIDLFMEIVIGRVLSKVSAPTGVEFIKKMMPTMLFLTPALSSVTITAGILLAVSEGIFNIHYYTIIAAGTIVIILLIWGLGVFCQMSSEYSWNLGSFLRILQKYHALA